MNEPRKCVGKGVKVGQYDMINIGLRYDTLTPNATGYVNLTVGSLREPDKNWNTHTVWVNDYKKPEKKPEIKPQTDEEPPFDDSELPF